MLPNDVDVKCHNQDILIPISDSQTQLSGWKISAPSQQDEYTSLPNEPANILTSLNVTLYLCGDGRNMGDYNYLNKISQISPEQILI